MAGVEDCIRVGDYYAQGTRSAPFLRLSTSVAGVRIMQPNMFPSKGGYRCRSIVPENPLCLRHAERPVAADLHGEMLIQ